MGFWWINDNGVNSLKGEPAYVAQDGRTFKTEAQASRYQMLTGLTYTTWTDSQGNPPDPTNQIVLPEAFILHCIRTIRKAREDFFAILPSLRPAEQDRLNGLLERNPNALVFEESAQTKSDKFQDRLNKSGIRTVGPRGGTRIGG